MFILFGATGDLAQKKIMPALQALPRMPIIAFSRRPWSDNDYRKFITPSLRNPTPDFLNSITYVQGQLDDSHAYKALHNKIKEFNSTELIAHLAIQPEYYADVFEQLLQSGLNENISKLLIEKPFGYDLKSALSLQHKLSLGFPEEKIYRVDHYTAKEGLKIVSDLAFKPKNIKRVTLRILDTADISGRGEFYDEMGALRDIGQNHLMVMYAAVTKDTNIENLAPIKDFHKQVTRAQYEGYTKDPEVAPESQTETYFKISTTSLDPEWEGVKFVFEGGKAMAENVSDISIEYKDGAKEVLDIQKPGKDAYVTVIEKAMTGDKDYFVSEQQVINSWQFVTPILEHFEDLELKKYKKGSRVEI